MTGWAGDLVTSRHKVARGVSEAQLALSEGATGGEVDAGVVGEAAFADGEGDAVATAAFAAHDPAGGPLVDAVGIDIEIGAAEFAGGFSERWGHPPPPPRGAEYGGCGVGVEAESARGVTILARL